MRFMHIYAIQAHSAVCIYCFRCCCCCRCRRCRLLLHTICLFLFLFDWHVVYCYAHIVCVPKTCLLEWYVIFWKSPTKNTKINGKQKNQSSNEHRDNWCSFDRLQCFSVFFILNILDRLQENCIHLKEFPTVFIGFHWAIPRTSIFHRFINSLATWNRCRQLATYKIQTTSN